MDDDGSNSAHTIRVHVRQNAVPVNSANLATIARRMLESLEIASAELDVLIVDDPAIAALNERHLGHEGATDIITFPISAPGDDHLEGELVISGPWAANVAADHGDDPFDEIVLYVAHGILHLTGQDDLTDEDAATMKARELRLLTAIGAPIPKGRFEHLRASDSRV